MIELNASINNGHMHARAFIGAATCSDAADPRRKQVGKHLHRIRLRRFF